MSSIIVNTDAFWTVQAVQTIRIASSMLEEPIIIPCSSWHGKSRVTLRIFYSFQDTCTQFRRNDFIAVERYHPIGGDIFYQPIGTEGVLLRETRPSILNKNHTMFAGNLFSSVGTEGINNKNAITEGKRLQTLIEESFSILNNNKAC